MKKYFIIVLSLFIMLPVSCGKSNTPIGKDITPGNIEFIENFNRQNTPEEKEDDPADEPSSETTPAEPLPSGQDTGNEPATTQQNAQADADQAKPDAQQPPQEESSHSTENSEPDPAPPQNEPEVKPENPDTGVTVPENISSEEKQEEIPEQQNIQPEQNEPEKQNTNDEPIDSDAETTPDPSNDSSESNKPDNASENSEDSENTENTDNTEKTKNVEMQFQLSTDNTCTLISVRILQETSSFTIPSSYSPSGETVVGIGAYAFANEDCSLTEIIIPASIKKIGAFAFYNCYALEKLIYAGTKEQWDAIEKEPDWDEGINPPTILYNGESAQTE